MNLPKSKMVMAPVLAITLALLLAGATASFPLEQDGSSVQERPLPEPTATQSLSHSPSTSAFATATPSPSLALPPVPMPTITPSMEPKSPSVASEPSFTPSPSTVPQPAGAVASNGSLFTLLFASAAVVVAIVAALVLFSEKGYNSYS